jgi:hypothetical protein
MLRMAEADRKRAYRAKFHRGSPSPTPPSNTEIQKQRENSPVTSPGLSRTNPPVLKLSERISLEKELSRVTGEIRGLGQLSDHQQNSKRWMRITELLKRQKEICKTIGATA